jgi:carbonic anhydrase
MKIHPAESRHTQTPVGSFNINAHFIAPNPRTTFNPGSVSPAIDPTAYVGPFSSVIGDVIVKKDVFIAPNVSIRADEGFPFYIGAGTNIQDGTILHGLEHSRVRQDGRDYSIYIGRHVSCTHGCIVHGPCKLGDRVFIGFHAIVFNALVGEGCYISTNALVTGGVRLAPWRFVPAGAIVDTQEKADILEPVPQSDIDFAQAVQHVNSEFPTAYSLLFGATRCSCGLSCDPRTVKAVLT